MTLEDVEFLLPPVVKEILTLIGFPSTLKLLDVLGGTTFTVGKGLKESGCSRMELLVSTIGQESAAKMSRHFGGDVLYIPRCERALKELRNRQLVADVERLRNEGRSLPWIMAELCPRYGISDRLAYYIIERYKRRDAASQRGLFEDSE
ncbi:MULTISPECIES: Mor transcription activator family protein [Serratia]|uniref:Mor transcription activator family protein n=1 Tax=Serratia TaxID=613 RepID=UPI000660F92B|nr:Mor transcription activator family protein [Serratia sp. 506_PEND]